MFKTKMESIYDIANEIVELKKCGNNTFKGLCPFHSEKTPSFFIYEDTNIFKCFGCGEYGGTKKLMSLSSKGIQKVERNIKRVESIHYQGQVLDEIVNYCSTSIFAIGNAHALNFLKERNICQNTILKNKIGYADKNLYKHISQQKFEFKDILNFFKYGKFILSESIIIPVRDIENNINGIIGRSFGEMRYKNLHSFDKSHSLFVDEDVLSKGDTLYITEGPTDALCLSQFFPSIATLGANISNEHIEHIKKFISKYNFKRVVICFDNDIAGFIGLLKLYTELNCEVYVIEWGDVIEQTGEYVKDICDISVKNINIVKEIEKYLTNDIADAITNNIEKVISANIDDTLAKLPLRVQKQLYLKIPKEHIAYFSSIQKIHFEHLNASMFLENIENIMRKINFSVSSFAEAFVTSENLELFIKDKLSSVSKEEADTLKHFMKNLLTDMLSKTKYDNNEEYVKRVLFLKSLMQDLL